MKRQKMTRAAGRVLLALVASFALVMAGCSQPGDGYEGDDGNNTEQNGGDGNNTNGGGGGNTNTGGGNGQQTGGGNGDGNGQQTGGGSGDGDGGDNGGNTGNGGGSGSGEVDDSKDTFGEVNWGPEYLPNSFGDTAIQNKYKMHIKTDTENPKVDIIQKYKDTEASIYVNCGGIPVDTSLGSNNFAVVGSGLYLYLTNFTAKETKFIITVAGKEYESYVYNADGMGTDDKTVAPDEDEDDEPEEPVDVPEGLTWDNNDKVTVLEGYKVYVGNPEVLDKNNNNGDIQIKNWDGEDGIYFACKNAVELSCSLKNSAVQNATVLVYLSNFAESEETAFKLFCDGQESVCVVLNENVTTE